MSVRIRVVCTHPPSNKIITVDDTDWGPLKATIAKTVGVDGKDLQNYNWSATRFGEDVVRLDKLDDKDKHGLTDKMILFVLAPAIMLAPLRRRAVKSDGKDGEEVEDQRFIGFTPDNVFKKIIKSQGKKKKLAFEYLDAFASEITKGKAFLALNKETLGMFLRRDTLSIPEIELFESLIKWGEAECKRQGLKPDEKKKVLDEFMPCIRFPTMQTEDVASRVAPTGLLDQMQVLDLFTYLAQKDVGAKPGKALAIFSSKPRSGEGGASGVHCKLPSDLHTDQGVFYMIGTDFGKTPHKNPHAAGLVTMSTSPSPSWTSGWSEQNLVDPLSTARTLRTDYCMNSGTYFMVDLKEFRVAITHYSMQNGGGRGIVLRDWTFDAKKKESDAWVPLRRHANDGIYANDSSGGYGIHSFEVENPKREYYRFFRINRTDSSRAIYVHRWELYGYLRKSTRGD